MEQYKANKNKHLSSHGKPVQPNCLRKLLPVINATCRITVGKQTQVSNIATFNSRENISGQEERLS